MQNLHNIIDQLVALKPQTIATDTTTVGETIDLADSQAVEMNLTVGTATDGDFAISFFESDDSGMSGEVEITDTDRIIGDVYNEAYTAVSLASLNWGVVKSLRYIRPKVVSTSTSSGSALSMVATLGRNRASLANERNA
jgi:hypothetical protein